MHYLRNNVIALILCGLAVWVGLAQDVPSGISGVLWPAAGIVLALMARFGWPVLPGIVLAHSLIFFSPLTDVFGSLVLVLALVAVVMQALAGYVLLKRFAPLPESLSSEVRVFLMVALGALSAAIAPIIVALACLTKTAVITEGCFAFAMLWWGWNFLSVLVFTPLTAILLHSGEKLGKQHLWVASTVAVIMLATISLFLLVRSGEETTRRAEFEKSATRLAGNISRSVDVYVGVLDSIKNFYAASVEVDREEFRTFTKRSILRYPAIQGLEWVPKVMEDEVDAYVARARADGLPDYKIWSRGDGKMFQNKQRIYFPIFYMEPRAGNEIAMGLDIASIPERHSVLRKAWLEDEAVATEPVTLVQPIGDSRAFLVVTPVYARNVATVTEAQRQENLRGFILGVFKFSEIIDSAVGDPEWRHMSFSVSELSMQGQKGTLFEMRRERALGYQFKSEMNVAGRHWLLEFSPTESFFRRSIVWSVWVLAGGMLVSGTIGIFLLGISGRASLVQVLVQERTQQLTAQQGELEDAKRAAENANQVKTNFLASMSHEIRSPLTSIVGGVDLLQDTKLTTQQARYFDIVRSSSETLLGLINDVLDIAKIEAQKLELNHEVFDLKHLCEEVVAMTHGVLKSKPVNVRLDYESDVPDEVEGDGTRVRQVLVNLMNNAAKFTERGHIILHVHLPDKQEAGASLPHIIRFAVEDTGIGIPPAKQRKIFNKYTQAESMTSRRYGGSGLGLAIAAELTQLMGGKIGLESEERRGTTFWFTLPLHPTISEAADPALHATISLDAMQFERAHVLLAEDNSVNQQIVRAIIESFGAQVSIAANGREAVDLATANHFSLIFMDCQMPELDGYQATRALRGKGNKTAIVALTGNTLESERQQCFKSGMDDYLPKPVRKDDIGRMLLKWLPDLAEKRSDAAS